MSTRRTLWTLPGEINVDASDVGHYSTIVLTRDGERVLYTNERQWAEFDHREQVPKPPVNTIAQ